VRPTKLGFEKYAEVTQNNNYSRIPYNNFGYIVTSPIATLFVGPRRIVVRL